MVDRIPSSMVYQSFGGGGTPVAIPTAERRAQVYDTCLDDIASPLSIVDHELTCPTFLLVSRAGFELRALEDIS